MSGGSGHQARGGAEDRAEPVAPPDAAPRPERPPRDHGGDLDRAVARFGGPASAWLDLSTGVNPEPYPIPALSPEVWTRLPSASAEAALLDAARAAYGAPAEAALAAAAGAQAAIQIAPRLRSPGAVAILSPTYNEHAAAFAAAGWEVRPAASLDAVGAAEAVVVVNPNNPDGRRTPPERLAALAAEGRFVLVDESFADVDPEISAVPFAGRPGLLILRSFGKFYGLAGARLGAAIGAPEDVARARGLLGPWAVSGPALEIGARALADAPWAAAARARLQDRAARLDALIRAAGWRPLGGTALFRLAETPDAEQAQARLAAARVWSRRFPYSTRWLRLGPPAEADMARLAAALS